MIARRSLVFALALALGVAACGHEVRPVIAPAAPASADPPRYALLDDGRFWSDAREPHGLLAFGRRLRLDGGQARVVEGGPAPALVGFAIVPARLGGGVVFWSSSGVFLAPAFDALLGAPLPAAPPRTRRATPFLGAMWLDGDEGAGLLDVRARAVRAAPGGIARAAASDGVRAARVDLLGRGSTTVDGGATWTDVTAPQGLRFSAPELDAHGRITLRSGSIAYLLDAAGGLVPPPDPRVDVAPPIRVADEVEVRLGARTQLAQQEFGEAVSAGVAIGGARVAVATADHVVVLSTRTGLEIQRAPLHLAGELCEALPLGPSARDGELLRLACRGDRTAVYAFDLARSTLDAEVVFDAAGSLVSGGGDALGFVGACASGGASSDSAAAALRARPSPDRARDRKPADAPKRPAEATICVRVQAGAWVEHRLGGVDARGAFRWIPQVGGAAVALTARPGAAAVQGKKGPEEAPLPVPPGVRVVRVDETEFDLRGARSAVQRRLVDAEAWIDASGAVRLWGRRRKAKDVPRADRRFGDEDDTWSPLSIAADGAVRALPYPEGVTAVAFGGRWALASSSKTGRFHESTDGGATWREVVAPPAPSAMEPTDPRACSAIGCHIGDAWLRVGWGGPTPTAPPALAPPLAQEASPPPTLRIDCKFPPRDAARARPSPRRELPSVTAAPELVGLGAANVRARAGAWSATTFTPFAPASPRRAVHASDKLLADATPPLIALTTPRGVDLLAQAPKASIRLSDGRVLPAVPIASAAVELAPDVLATLEMGWIRLWRGGVAARVVEVRSDHRAARLTLGRTAKGGLVLLGVDARERDVWVSDVDVGRGSLGAVRSLGALDARPCVGKPEITAVVDLRLPVTVDDAATPDARASALLRVAGGAACIDAIEAKTSQGLVSARWPRATLRAASDVAGTCRLAQDLAENRKSRAILGRNDL